MQTLPTDYSHQQLCDALLAEYVYLIHDDYDEDLDMSEEEYKVYLSTLTHSQLVEETCTDDEFFPLSEFMHAYS